MSSRVSYYNNLYNALNRMYGNSSVSGKASQNSNNSKSNISNLSNLQGLASEYAQIRSGNYKKLVKSYYEKGGQNESSGGTVFDEMSRLRTVSGYASSLKDSLSSMKRADFKGDVEGSLEKIKNFISNYNSVIDTSVEVDRQGVLRDTLSMVNTTRHSANLLNEVGITVGSDNKLTLDEEKWNNAHLSTKQTLFNGTGSLAERLMYKASEVSSGAAAGTGLSTRKLGYTNTANYSKQPASSSFLDFMF